MATLLYLFWPSHCADEDTEGTQRGKMTWQRQHSRSGQRWKKPGLLTPGLGPSMHHQSVTLELSSTLPAPAQWPHMTLGKGSSFCPKKHAVWSASFSLIFSSPFLWSNTGLGWRGSTQVSGVSLWFHHKSESPTNGRMKCKAGPSDKLLGPSQDCLSHPQGLVLGNTRPVCTSLSNTISWASVRCQALCDARST